MDEFLKELFRLERDLVRLSYWISALEWGHYSQFVESRADRARRDVDVALTSLRTLRGEVKQKED